MILNERDARHEHILQVARQMMTAARTAPKGKGIHTVAFHERAAKIMGSMKKSGKGVNRNEAYAIAMKQLGRKKSVLKKHQK